jgi:uncharacterized protein (TIGR02246 family)
MSTRSEIEDAFYRYALAYDEDDLDGMARCFAPDATLSTTMNDDRAEGREQIRALFEGRRAGRRNRAEQCRHIVGNVMILEETADEALALVYNTLLTTTGTQTQAAVMAGWYRSRMVRSEGTWLIREHLIHVDAGQRVPARPSSATRTP